MKIKKELEVTAANFIAQNLQQEKDHFNPEQIQKSCVFYDEFALKIEELLKKNDYSQILKNFDTEEKVLKEFNCGLSTRENFYDIKLNILHLLAFLGHDELLGAIFEQIPSFKNQSGTNTLELRTDKYEFTCLSLAALKGSVKVAELLVKNGANIEIKDFEDRTPLAIAAYEGHNDFAEFALRNGANVETISLNDSTPLIIAATEGFEKIVKCLIEYGANIEATDRVYETALIGAISRGHHSVVKLLLEYGANKDVMDEDASPIIHIPVYEGDHEMIKLLIEYGAITDAKDRDGKTALEIALKYALNNDKSIACVKELLKSHKTGSITDYIPEDRGQNTHSPKVVEFIDIYETFQRELCLFDNGYKKCYDPLGHSEQYKIWVIKAIKSADGMKFAQELIETYPKANSLPLSYYDINNFIEVLKIHPDEILLKHLTIEECNKFNDMLDKAKNELIKTTFNTKQNLIEFELELVKHFQHDKVDDIFKNLKNHRNFASEEISGSNSNADNLVETNDNITSLSNIGLTGAEIPGDGKILSKFMSTLLNLNISEFNSLLNSNFMERFENRFKQISPLIDAECKSKIEDVIAVWKQGAIKPTVSNFVKREKQFDTIKVECKRLREEESSLESMHKEQSKKVKTLEDKSSELEKKTAVNETILHQNSNIIIPTLRKLLLDNKTLETKNKELEKKVAEVDVVKQQNSLLYSLLKTVIGDNANESMQSALESLGAFFPEQTDPNHPEMKPLGQNMEIEHDSTNH
jgi:ankyrin repeat protein